MQDESGRAATTSLDCKPEFPGAAAASLCTPSSARSADPGSRAWIGGKRAIWLGGSRETLAAEPGVAVLNDVVLQPSTGALRGPDDAHTGEWSTRCSRKARAGCEAPPGRARPRCASRSGTGRRPKPTSMLRSTPSSGSTRKVTYRRVAPDTVEETRRARVLRPRGARHVRAVGRRAGRHLNRDGCHRAEPAGFRGAGPRRLRRDEGGVCRLVDRARSRRSASRSTSSATTGARSSCNAWSRCDPISSARGRPAPARSTATISGTSSRRCGRRRRSASRSWRR